MCKSNIKCKCIICNEIKENMSVEHIIPDAIGGNITIETVCKDCNSRLGSKVDCALTDDPFILYLRNAFEIKDKNGNLVDLTKRLPLKDETGKRIVIKKGDGELFPKIYTGNTAPNVKITKTTEGKRKIEFSGSDVESILTKTKREFDKEGIPFCESDVRDKLIEQVKENLSLKLTPVEYKGQVDLGKYIPCVLKIAYETAHYILGDKYTNDSVGEEIRQYLYDYVYTNKNLTPPKVENKVISYDFVPNHSIELLRCGRVIMAHIQLFGRFDFIVTVSASAQNYRECFENV